MTTDRGLRDLLHDSVRDLTMPDASAAAWTAGARRRRRRTTRLGAGAALAAVVVAAAVALWLGHPDTGPEPSDRPDGVYHGTRVWWGPRPSAEAALPQLPERSGLPATVDLSGSAPALATYPIQRAVAAYGLVTRSGAPRVVVVGPTGELRTVDLSSVKPMTDPAGGRRLDIAPSMLSPSGRFLMFPQDVGIDVLDLSTGAWQWVYTVPGQTTWRSTWNGNSIRVDSGSHWTYSVDPPQKPGSWSSVGLVLPRHQGSPPYGIWRSGGLGNAQAYRPGAEVPEPAGLAPGRSSWIGVADGSRGGLLLLPATADRLPDCCQVDAYRGTNILLFDSRSTGHLRVLAWQIRTHRFWRVTEVTGVPRGTALVSSYADQP